MATGDSNAAPVVTLSDRQLVVEYPSFREFINLSVSTLSEEGMFVEVQTPKAAGSRLSFVLRIADGFQLMQGEAEVVAVREFAAGQSPEGMSIRFQDLDEPGQRLLAKVVDSHRRQGETLFVLEKPAPAVTEAAPVEIEADATGGLEQEIPELAEIEASVRQEVRPPEPEPVPPSDQSLLDMDEASPPTLVTPPYDVAIPPPSTSLPEQSFENVDEVSPPTLVTPPDDLDAGPPAESLFAEPEISILDLPPVESQSPLPEPPRVELPEIGGMDVAPTDSEDVRWEEPVAISPPPTTSFEPPPTVPRVPEIRFTEELADVPVPDELVVASGALKWPDETGAVGETDMGMAESEPSLGTHSTKRRSGRGLFLLLVVAILAGAAGYAYYMGLLQPYVEVLTSSVASFIEGESEVVVSAPLEPLPPIDESATEGAEAEAESTSPSTAVTETPPVAPAPTERREVVPVVSKLSRVERISWEELGGETLLMLWTDDVVVGGQVELSRIEGDDARVIIKVYGVTRAPDESALDVGTSHIDRIRTGLHKEPQGSVLHVVADLTGADVYVRDMTPQGSRLQVYFAKR
ncbi:MAG: PilZ domain-containing protein [Thermoanaerobaculia bacterium]